jgi:hypothetical protein
MKQLQDSWIIQPSETETHTSDLKSLQVTETLTSDLKSPHVLEVGLPTVRGPFELKKNKSSSFSCSSPSRLACWARKTFPPPLHRPWASPPLPACWRVCPYPSESHTSDLKPFTNLWWILLSLQQQRDKRFLFQDTVFNVQRHVYVRWHLWRERRVIAGPNWFLADLAENRAGWPSDAFGHVSYTRGHTFLFQKGFLEASWQVSNETCQEESPMETCQEASRNIGPQYCG